MKRFAADVTDALSELRCIDARVVCDRTPWNDLEKLFLSGAEEVKRMNLFENFNANTNNHCS